MTALGKMGKATREPHVTGFIAIHAQMPYLAVGALFIKANLTLAAAFRLICQLIDRALVTDGFNRFWTSGMTLPGRRRRWALRPSAPGKGILGQTFCG